MNINQIRLNWLAEHYGLQKHVNQSIGSDRSRDLSKLSPETRERMADSRPLANERVLGMDVSHNAADARWPEAAKLDYVGHFLVNGKRYELGRAKEGG